MNTGPRSLLLNLQAESETPPHSSRNVGPRIFRANLVATRTMPTFLSLEQDDLRFGTAREGPTALSTRFPEAEPPP